jgi:c-di-GMP-binding flagellar brake protein YcgR
MVPLDNTLLTLKIGLRVIIQAETRGGHLGVPGEITYIGNHHFRVACDTPFPVAALPASKAVKVAIEGNNGVMPMNTRLVRPADQSARTVILGIPERPWRHNRRAFFRGHVEARVTLSRQDGTVLTGRAVNLSGGGVLAELDPGATTPLAKLEELDIIMIFPDGDDITAKVRVVRVEMREDHLRYGIKFITIARRDQDRICRMVIVQEFEKRRAEIRELVERTPK